MKKRYFKALLALLLALLLPSKMWADYQCYVELAVNNSKAFDDADVTYTLTFKYGEKPADNTTAKYFDLTDKDAIYGVPSWLGYKQTGQMKPESGYDYAPKITTAKLDDDFTDKFEGTTCARWFQHCNQITEIEGIGNLKTSKVTDMSFMFYICSSLTSLPFGDKWNTANVTDMRYMFRSCTALTSLDVSKFNTAKVTNMEGMFRGCSNLTTLTLSNFDTSNVTTMEYMFEASSGFTSLDLRSFDTSNVNNMGGMFSGCTNLASIHVDLLNWTTDAVNSSDNMFNKCTSLPSYSTVSDKTANSCPTFLTYHFKDTYDGTALSNKLNSLSSTTLQSLVLERTFTKDIYGTICLPVSLSATQVTSTFGSGTVVKELTGAAYDSNNNRLTLTFTNVTSSGMTAGKPYLIKSAKTDPETITGATIGATTGGSTDEVDDLCQMHGVLNPTYLAASENNLFVSNGTLYYSTGGTMNGMRAYFTLHGDAATAANNSQEARPRAVINFDDAPSETGILSIDADGNLTYEETDDWYTLGGVKLSGKPASKGMYILNGKKYIVK